VQAGATTRLSTILHGIWILGFVALLPWLLREIPMAALGGILVVTGFRLVSVSHVTHLFRHYGILPAIIWVATLVTVVAEDLLTGVLVGLGLSLLELIPHIRRLNLRVDAQHGEANSHVALDGAATFVMLPKLTRTLEEVPPNSRLTLDLARLTAIDHTSAEMLNDWLQRRRAAGMRVALAGAEGRFPGLKA
jgi:MFS superfamily sulfate permease-like transporter